jgi:predicted nucleotidyltransferase
VREAAALFKEDAGNLSKELASMEKAGVFCAATRGKQKYFSLNRKYPLYNELKSVIFKTIGIEGSLKELINSIVGVRTAFIYGSFAQNQENAASDIDLLIIGAPDDILVMEKIEDLENRLKREINYNIYSEKEFKQRLKQKDSFVLNLLKRPKIILKGNLGGI